MNLIMRTSIVSCTIPSSPAKSSHALIRPLSFWLSHVLAFSPERKGIAWQVKEGQAGSYDHVCFDMNACPPTPKP